MDVKSQLNQQQAKALAQIREVTKEWKLPDSSDAYLLRWLNARDFDLKKTEEMLRKTLEWRLEYAMDDLLDNFQSPQVLHNYLAFGCVGVDKTNSPLLVFRFGRTDVKGLLQSITKKEYIRHVYGLLEQCGHRLIKDPEEFGLCPSTTTPSFSIICDFEEFGMRHIANKQTMDLTLQIAMTYENHYPGLVRRVYVVNGKYKVYC